MPILALLLSQALSWISVHLAVMFGVRIALAAAFVIVSLAVFTAYTTAINALVSTIQVTMPAAVGPLATILPSNLAVCIGIWLLAETIHASYSFWMRTTGQAFKMVAG